MIPKTLEGFVNRLTTETSKGSIPWYEGLNDAYVCENKKFTVFVKHFFDEENNESSFNVRIQKVGTSDAVFSVSDREVEDYSKVRNLYEAASITPALLQNIDEEFFGPQS